MLSILPKSELENVNFCPTLLGYKFFIRFLGELKKKQKAILTDLYTYTIENQYWSHREQSLNKLLVEKDAPRKQIDL